MKSLTSLTSARTNPSILLVGPPKSGKTTFALQFPKVYLADCDNNLDGPARWLKLNKPSALASASADIIKLLPDGKERPDGACWEALIKSSIAAAMDPSIETVVIDGLTWVSLYLQWHLMKAQGKTEMTLPMWQPWQHMLMKFIITLRSSGKTIIFLAHEECEKDEADNMMKYQVAIPTRLAKTVGGLFTDFWRAEYIPGPSGAVGKYQIRTMPKINFSLGNSLGLPPIIDMDYEREIAPRLV